MGEKPRNFESNPEEQDIMRQAEDFLACEPQDDVDVMTQRQLKKAMSSNWPEKIRKETVAVIMGTYHKLKESNRETQRKVGEINEEIAGLQDENKQASEQFKKISDELKKKTGRGF